MGRHASDITGQKFNRLTAVEHLGKGIWLCKCDCGKEIKARGALIRNGRIRSCGCMRFKKTAYVGCDEDCFNCQYDDCLRPMFLCSHLPEVKGQW